MNHPLPPDELSRRAMLLLEQEDELLAALEADPTAYTVAEYNRRWQEIRTHQAWLREQYQREKAAK